MISNIIDYLKNMDNPIIPVLLLVVLIAALMLGVLLERRKDKNDLGVEEEYFNSIVHGDTPLTKSVLKNYKRYTFAKLESGESDSYYLKDESGKLLYECHKIEDGDGYEEYVFNNVKERRSHTNKIGEVTVDKYGKKTFDFDGTDIWEFFKNRNITSRITKANPFVKVCTVYMGDGRKVFGKKDDRSDDTFCYKITTNEKEFGYFFLFFFTVLKTENDK